MAEHGLLPDWVCGISIGPINAAVIAGNDPEERLARLEALWEFISWPPLSWDGGCVSNTPLEAVLEDRPQGHTVVFMIDLWSASGPPPRTMNDVPWREKRIQYASRTAEHIDAVATKVNLRHAIGLLKEAGTPALDQIALDGGGTGSRLDIVHIVYHPTADQIPNSDGEFSRASIRERRRASHADMTRAIAAEPWLRQDKPPHFGAVVHR